MTVLNSMLVLAAGLNLSSALIALTSLAAFIVIAFYVYRLSLTLEYPTSVPWNISGGLIFIALVLIVRQLTAIWSLASMEVWGEDFWQNLSERFDGGQGLLLKLIIALEIITNTFLIVGSAFLLLLFFKTRDIFPRTFTIIVILQEVFVLLDTIGVSLLFEQFVTEDIPMVLLKSVGRWVVIALMIGYVMRSERSTHTFVYPHSSLMNEEDPDFLADLEEEENKKGAH
ncbi:DUF2569 family protein [Chitinophaga sp. YIM B06452]|uniref:DUF2569 family protein n=1 Tax=Chitinophaga sp. YIM B06452 TaxID=3082158 RepID=UPI0031FE4ADE